MPNGLHLSDTDFYRATITVRQYLLGLENYLERMLAFGATDEATARRWFSQALSTLGYADYTTYEARVETDTRTINPTYPPLEHEKMWEIPGVTPEVTPTRITPEMLMPGLQLPSSTSLPYFKQIAAPTVYRKEAERLAVQYGYVDEKGNIVNEASYNTLLRNAIKDAETYKYGFIQENLQYQEDVAKAAGDTTKAEKAAGLRKEVDLWLGQQRQEIMQRETGGITEAIKRAEAWAGVQRAGELVRREKLGERVGAEVRAEEEAVLMRGETVQEFLEEGRPAGLQEFIRGKLPSVLEKFEREQAGARRAWWTTIQRPAHEEALREAEFEQQRWQEMWLGGIKAGLPKELAVRAAELGRPLTQQEMTPEEYYFTIATRKTLEYQREAEALRGYTPEQIARADRRARPREIPEDPLKDYLAQYQWKAEFMKLSPSQRGFAPSRFAPSARWFV